MGTLQELDDKDADFDIDITEITSTQLPNIELESGPDGIPLEINLHKNSKTAFYNVRTNKIEICSPALTQPQEVLDATCRHEKSHYLFANLSYEDQQELVDLFADNVRREISAYHYFTYKSKTYDPEYFGSKHGFILKNLAQKNGFGEKYYREFKYSIGEEEQSETFTVNATLLVDECVAYMVTLATDREALPQDSEHWKNTRVFIERIVSHMPESLKTKIKELGFYNIEGVSSSESIKNALSKIDSQPKDQ